MAVNGPGPENDRGARTQQITIAMCAVALVFLSTRIYTRFSIVKNPGLDDVSVSMAWIFALGMTVAISFETHYGLGQHMETLRLDQIINLLKSFWVSIIFYQLAHCFTKLALILQYLRLFTQPWFRRAAWATLIFICVYYITFISLGIVACVPVQGFWDPRVKSSCVPRAVAWYMNAALNVATDLMIIILPMPVLKNLHMPFKQRLALMGVFALGGFVCVVSVIRIKNLHDIANSPDITYYNTNSAVWSAIEVYIGIICACLPVIKATVTKFFPRLFSSTLSNTFSRDNQGTGYLAGSGKRGYGQNSRMGNDLESKANHIGDDIPYAATVITAKPMTRNQSLTAGKPHGDVDTTELDTFPAAGPRGASPPRDGKIDVITVVEQAVEHRHPAHSGDGSAKDESDTGSERALYTYSYER